MLIKCAYKLHLYEFVFTCLLYLFCFVCFFSWGEEIFKKLDLKGLKRKSLYRTVCMKCYRSGCFQYSHSSLFSYCPTLLMISCSNFKEYVHPQYMFYRREFQNELKNCILIRTVFSLLVFNPCWQVDDMVPFNNGTLW